MTALADLRRLRSARAYGGAEKPSGIVGELAEPILSDAHTAGSVRALDPINGTALGTLAGFPGLDERPCFRVYDEMPSQNNSAGLYFHGIKQNRSKDAPQEPDDVRIGAPLHVDAVTRDTDGKRGFGRLLRFRDGLDCWRTWAMPMTMLAGDGNDLVRELVDQGYELDFDLVRVLRRYLSSRAPELQLVSCSRTGWHGQGAQSAFVFPDVTIGSTDYVFQTEGAAAAAFAQAGTREGWRTEVAAPCSDNPLLQLCVSAGFAGPLMMRAGVDHIGIHLYGPSSSGKTTGLRAAASVFGGDTYRRTWRATANGLEGAAALANDALLALDEIGEADPDEVGAVIYALGNGTGKSRANIRGAARVPYRWRTVLVSTGERAIADVIHDNGRRHVNAGQTVRALDIAAHAGLIRSHEGFDSAGAMAEALVAATRRHHGHVGRAFIERLLADPRDMAAVLRETTGEPEFALGDGQVRRAAQALALIGMAGELATEYKLTGWKPGSSLEAAAEVLKAWVAARGGQGQPLEYMQTLNRLQSWLAAHGESGFTEVSDRNLSGWERFGWWREKDGSRTWYLLPDALGKALNGIDRTAAVGHLKRAGWIAEHDAGRQTKKLNIGSARHNVYAVKIPETDG